MPTSIHGRRSILHRKMKGSLEEQIHLVPMFLELPPRFGIPQPFPTLLGKFQPFLPRHFLLRHLLQSLSILRQYPFSLKTHCPFIPYQKQDRIPLRVTPQDILRSHTLTQQLHDPLGRIIPNRIKQRRPSLGLTPLLGAPASHLPFLLKQQLNRLPRSFVSTPVMKWRPAFFIGCEEGLGICGD